MSDKRDEPGAGDGRRPAPDETAPYEPVQDDRTAPYEPVRDDRTAPYEPVRDGGADETQRYAPTGDETQRYAGAAAETERYTPASEETQRFGGTAEQPTVQQPWSGRAGVPPPGVPPRGPAPTEWAEPPDPDRRPWWMPILLGLLALVLLGVLAFGLWLLLRDDGNTPEPTPSPTVAPTTVAPTSAPPTSAPPTSAPPTTAPAEVVVPPVIGRSLADARDLLEEAGLQPQIEFVESDQPDDTVVDADPAPGDRIPTNSSVVLYVSQGPPPTTQAPPPSSPPASPSAPPPS